MQKKYDISNDGAWQIWSFTESDTTFPLICNQNQDKTAGCFYLL